MERHLIEKAYECAKTKFKKSSFSFKNLYDILLKEEPSIKDVASDLYIEILQDIRFISLGKQKWALRENFTVDEINKITSSMFGLEEYHEEDADQYMSELEKKELKSKIEKEEELLLDVSDDEDDNIDKPNIRKLANQDDEEEEIEKNISSSDIKQSNSLDDEDGADSDDEDDVPIIDDEEAEIDEEDI